MIDMNNKNALVSTAMLATIWEIEGKETLDLILPFVMYSIGKTTSQGTVADITTVSEYVSDTFGFSEIPNNVIYKTFIRLTKNKVLEQIKHEYVLGISLDEKCRNIDLQLAQAKQQTDTVVTALTVYLNERKERLFKKELSREDVELCFGKFLESKGYLVYIGDHFPWSQEGPSHYHIAQFILSEYKKKTDLFTFIDNIAKGFLLSRAIYGYPDLQCDEKFKDVSFFLDTTLLLQVLGFKTKEENAAATQLIGILRANSISVKCFKHNYEEVYGILVAHKNNLLNPRNRFGKTLEYFDDRDYSVTDIDLVLVSLGSRFETKGIEVVNKPSLSNDGSALITQNDFQNAIGEKELKEDLSKSLYYMRETALDNDVSSISSIYILRRGMSFPKIEKCPALFVTTNYRFVQAVCKYNTVDSIPLVMTDMELTVILWLKGQKRVSDFPTLKLIEAARISMEPTEQIRDAFNKKVNAITISEEEAAAYRLLLYVEREKLMELVDADPNHMEKIEREKLKSILHQYVAPESYQKIQDLNRIKERLASEAEERVNKAGNVWAARWKIIVYTILGIILLCGVIGVFKQFLIGGSLVLLLFSIISIVDILVPRLRHINKFLTIMVNKRKAKVRQEEQERVKNILEEQSA